jgi:hypothetical protein
MLTYRIGYAMGSHPLQRSESESKGNKGGGRGINIAQDLKVTSVFDL